jgi:hypothetical protein
MDERRLHIAWPIVMALAGLALLGLETVLIAPASAWFALRLFDESFWPIESVIVQAVLVAAGLLVMFLALGSRSRIAYIVALLIGLGPAITWLYLASTQDPAAIDRTVVRLFAASLLILTGLGFAWPSFRHATSDPEHR